MIAFLDRLLLLAPRRWYFDYYRGLKIKSYRIERENLAEGVNGMEMWRYKIMVRYRYTWYHADDEGNCEAEGFNLKPAKTFFRTREEALLAQKKLVEQGQGREYYSITRKLYRRPCKHFQSHTFIKDHIL